MVTLCQLLKQFFEVPDLHRQRRLSNRAGGRGPPEMPVFALKRDRQQNRFTRWGARKWREPMMLSARRISSASTRKTNCSIAGASMLRACSRHRMLAASYSRQWSRWRRPAVAHKNNFLRWDQVEAL